MKYMVLIVNSIVLIVVMAILQLETTADLKHNAKPL
jgi:hypothetical protein